MRRVLGLVAWVVWQAEVVAGSDTWSGVGRWQTPTGNSTVEFLRDGNFVMYGTEAELVKTNGSARTEQDRKVMRAGSYQVVSNELMHAAWANCGMPYAHWQTWKWQLFDLDNLLTLIMGETTTVWVRAELPVPDAHRSLIGLWRRLNGAAQAPDYLGMMFTPGGFSVHLGRLCAAAVANKQTIFAPCCMTRYEVVADGILREIELDGDSPQERFRKFFVRHNRLGLDLDTERVLLFERVRGQLPFHLYEFDVRRWQSLPSISP